MTAPKKVTTTVSARRKLELSQLTTQAVQQELMGTDVNMTDFALYFEQRLVVPHLAERIVDAKVSRAMDASSTFTVVVNDYDRALLSSDQLYNKLDVQIDGLWFRLAGVDKAGDELTLTFEDREIAVLRSYNTWKVASRDKVTRAEFILNLIREVKEFRIPVVIPELHTVQPLQRYDGDNIGFDQTVQKVKGMPKNPKVTNTFHIPLPSFGGNAPGINVGPFPGRLTIEGSPVPKGGEQERNGQIIIAVGQQMKNAGVTRRLIVCAIMSAMVESTLINNPGDPNDPAHNTSAGLFQMQYFWGSYTDRTNPATAARIYYQHLMAEDRQNPGLPYGELCANTENPAAQYRYKYQLRYEEANQWVNAFGDVGGDLSTVVANTAVNGQSPMDTAGGSFYFWRGNVIDRSGQKIRKPEDSWTCILRLAKEVNWEAFFVGGTFYYISDDDLIKQQPLLTLDEYDDGIVDVSGDYHTNKKAGTLTVTARAGRWAAPPGSVVIIENMGPYNGRWLVSQYDRGMFDLNVTITLNKKNPALPEPNPAKGNLNNLNSGWVPSLSKTGTPIGGAKTKQGTSVGPAPVAIGGKAGMMEYAQKLLDYYASGQYRADNPGDLVDIRAAAGGGMVNSQCGGQVYMDYRPFAIVCYLIEQGFAPVGTFAFCSDHSCDGGGHSAGLCVDVSSLKGLAINTLSQTCFNNVLAADTLLHSLTGNLAPKKLISGGYGNQRNMQLTALCVTDPRGENPDSYYTPTVMGEHCNHIHIGWNGS